MCVCVCTYIRTYVHVCMYVCMYGYMLCVCTYVHVCMYVLTCLLACMHTCLCGHGGGWVGGGELELRNMAMGGVRGGIDCLDA